ncbi:GPN-loop GTPase 3 [Dendroctonus ponderosae]|uniref:GPN-loop GTPase 3 n=2 Tax=Dendroctonus ponderosae TaxID=77166 RepID=A0AAR5PDU5_DENPD|nr:GPN-loop GTPase 3 [Dendroctonus ponderosae]XP_019759229.1 GPN-loop GTPase 3 [Dendroctonus ponderosae]XP_019759230.1 GPN-loop GTPase 3 [Dendroctonus ponderosae]
MRFAQLVVGPAGSGKSTYCSAVAQYGADMNRNIEVINLDPAAEHFDYTPLVDIRELIQVQDTMEDEELHFGPNGGLVFCIEYLLENADWLRTRLGEHEDDYILFDCPGQIELYTHLTAIKRLITLLQDWNFNVCSVFLMDVQFMTDGSKFLSGTMAALSIMVNLELPHVNILSKMDLLSKTARRRLERFLEPDSHAILGDIELNGLSAFNLKYKSLTESFGKLIEDYSLVRFIPLNLKNHENMGDLLITIDNVIQYGEDQDIKTKDFEEEEPDVFENLTNE